MRLLQVAFAILAVVLVACGGESDASAGENDTNAPTEQTQPSGDETSGGGAGTELDPNFDIGVIPDDFPAQLLPDSFTAGFYAELGGVRNANFESDKSFDELVAGYTEKIGEPPTVVEGEQRLASWVVDDVWIVSIFDENPTLIGISHAG